MIIISKIKTYWDKIEEKYKWLMAAIFYVVGLTLLSIPIWGIFGDPYTIVRFVIGTNISVVQAVTLMAISVTAVDNITKGQWWNEIIDGNISVCIVTSVIIVCCFWVSIQG